MENSQHHYGKAIQRYTIKFSVFLGEINRYFQGINSDSDHKGPNRVAIPEMTRLPVIDEFTSFKLLSHLEKTASGLDGLSYSY